VQAQALFVTPEGLAETPSILERELAMLEELKQEGWRQITRLEDALPGEANLLLTIEGGEAFGDDEDNVERMAEIGVRMAALTWNNPNLIAQAAALGEDHGLTDFGRQVVRRMQKHHMAADVSHLNQRGFWDLLEMGIVPIATHSCARALCDHSRNLTDDQLRALFEVNGYVGINFYSTFLNPDSKASLDTVVDHMAYMCDLGGENCVGFGSDFDGIDIWPDGLRNAGDVYALMDRMRSRGFGEKLVEKIAGLNFKRYLSLI
jgi:membrane dipeptidase